MSLTRVRAIAPPSPASRLLRRRARVVHSIGDMATREVCVRLLNDPTECVAIDLDRLPNDAEDCAGVLQAELAPLESWIEIAEAYLARGDERGFKTLMEMVCAPGAWTRAPRPTGRDARANERTNERKRANVCAIER